MKNIVALSILIFPCLTYSEQTSLLDMSLEELMNIDLSGDSVRSIDLNKTPQTANHFGQVNIDLPYSIEVMTANSISAKGLKNIVQVVGNMTGVISGESPSEPYSFSTRGFDRNSISVVYDGISMGLSTLNMRPQPTFNIEQVEVIKGPTISTQGGAAGTINIITKKAKLVEHHKREIFLTAGEYGTRSYNFGVSGPINAKTAYRLDLSKNVSNGWVDDTESNTTNISGSYFWQINNDVDILFSLVFLDDELPAYWGTPFVPSNAAKSPVSNIINTDHDLVIDKSTRFSNYNVSDSEITSTSLWKRIDSHWSINNQLNTTTTVYTFDADRRWANAESYFYNPDIEQVERDRLLVEHDRDNWGITTEFSYQHSMWSLPSQSALKFEVNSIAFFRNIGFNFASPDLYLDSVDLFEIQNGVFGDVDLRNDSLNQKTQAIAFNNLLKVSDNLSLNTSIRYDKIYFDRQHINWNGSIRERQTIDTIYNETSYSVGLTQKIHENSSLYGHYRVSHDPVFGDFRFTYEIDNFEPSHLTQVEVGYKSVIFDDSTEFTVAIYQIEKEVKTQIDQNSEIFTSKRNVKGIDFSINSEISEQLLIGGDFAYVNANNQRFFDQDLGVDASFKEPINVPDLIANLRFSYQIPHLSMEIGGGLNYVSARWANSVNTIELESYLTQNLYASYNGGNFLLAVHINNVSDEIYAPWSDSTYPNQVILSQPKLIEVNYRVNF